MKIFRLPSDTVMTTELLSKYITKHKSEVKGQIGRLDGAYKNDYKIYHLPKKAKYKPDNRVGVNFAKYMVDTMNGYFIGHPIKVNSDDKKVDEYLQFLDKYNSLDDTNAELSKLSSIFGAGYEMYFVDEEAQIGITYVSPMEGFIIYDESIIERPLFFIRYYKDYNNVERGSYSDGNVVRHFVNSGGIHWTDEPKIHGFKDVPATELVENDERMSIFESALSMMDEYNKALSEKANDVDYFADAYLKVIGTMLERSDISFIRDNRIINFEGDGGTVDVDFLQKPSADETQEHLIDRLERLIFQTSMVANINEEDFGTASGEALKYRLQSMANLAMTKERKFSGALDRRYKVIFSNPLSGMSQDDWVKVSYQFTRNMPSNVTDEVAAAKNAEGMVSKESQLKLLSFIDDVQAEMDRIEAEKVDDQNSTLNRVLDFTVEDDEVIEEE